MTETMLQASLTEFPPTAIELETLKRHPCNSTNALGPMEDELRLATSERPSYSKLKLLIVVLQPCVVNFFSSFSTGLITVGLPIIARSVNLPRELYLWPASVYGLTCGAMLLLAGAIADIVGARIVELVGIVLLGVFSLACSLSQTGVHLVIFRALQGIAMAMHLPSSVSIVAAATPPGRTRNLSFACLGLSQPLGFSVGLVVNGIMIDRVGWRSGFYLTAAALLITGMTSMWTIPKSRNEVQHSSAWKMIIKLCRDIDWTGSLIASGGLAMLAYVLAILSADLSNIKSPTAIVLLVLSVILLAAFPIWIHYREQHGKSALVPLSLWKDKAFATTCVMVALSAGANNAMELFSSLYFQEVQAASTLSTSLRLLPNLLTGVLINLAVGFFVDRVPARWLVVISSSVCCVSCAMMAIVNPSWSYWYLEFWAQIFAPFSIDVLFTVGLIIVSDSFPETMQALAGAVFNTVAQFGTSLGIGICQVVALSVAESKEGSEASPGDNDQGALLRGYRASFWTMFACMALCVMLAVVGLHRTHKIGLKKD